MENWEKQEYKEMKEHQKNPDADKIGAEMTSKKEALNKGMNAPDSDANKKTEALKSFADSSLMTLAWYVSDQLIGADKKGQAASILKDYQSQLANEFSKPAHEVDAKKVSALIDSFGTQLENLRSTEEKEQQKANNGEKKEDANKSEQRKEALKKGVDMMKKTIENTVNIEKSKELSRKATSAGNNEMKESQLIAKGIEERIDLPSATNKSPESLT